MTFAQYSAFSKRHEEERTIVDYRFGSVVVTLQSLFSKRPKKMQPLKIWPWQKRGKAAAKQADAYENLLALAKFQQQRTKEIRGED